MAGRIRTLLAIGDIRGEVEPLKRVFEKLPETGADAVEPRRVARPPRPGEYALVDLQELTVEAAEPAARTAV
jgi:hypothetical protein